MSTTIHFSLRWTLPIALALTTSFASATDPVTDAMQKAYGPYRVALFKTNSNSQAEAQQAVAQAQQGWGQIATQFGSKPPAPYDRDAAFATSLAGVSKVYAKAAEQIAQNQLPEAHETLEAARDIMADLRHRNQVIVYSDHMNAYHAQMEDVINEGPALLGKPDGMFQLTAESGVLGYLGKQLASEAPEGYAKNEEFAALYKAVDKSVADLKAALQSQDAARVKDAIGKLKVPYSKMFIKFG